MLVAQNDDLVQDLEIDEEEDENGDCGRDTQDINEMMNVLLWTPVVKRIPRACRHKAAVTLTKIIRSVIDDPDIEKHWKELLQFAGTCLRRPRRGGKKAKRLATVISDQITNFKNTCCNKEIVQNRERKVGGREDI